MIFRLPDRKSPRNSSGGFSYLEVLIATALIAVCLVPIVEALQVSLLGSQNQQVIQIDRLALRSKMEEVLAESYSALAASAAAAGAPNTPSSYSDSFTTSDNRQISRQVFLAQYDGDNADADNDPFSGSDAGLIFVSVETQDGRHRLSTLYSQ